MPDLSTYESDLLRQALHLAQTPGLTRPQSGQMAFAGNFPVARSLRAGTPQLLPGGPAGRGGSQIGNAARLPMAGPGIEAGLSSELAAAVMRPGLK